MNSNIKAIFFSLLFFILIFIITFFFLRSVFDLTDGPITGVISAVNTAIFSLRRTIIKKQSGEEVQLIWLFTKKAIRIK